MNAIKINQVCAIATTALYLSSGGKDARLKESSLVRKNKRNTKKSNVTIFIFKISMQCH